MKRNIGMILVGLVVAAIFIFLQIVFIVRQGEVAILTRFGRPVTAIQEPGLYRRWPWPIEKIYTYDNRTRPLEGSFEETLTQDGKNVLVSLYAGWRIQDPIKFIERVGALEQAESNLDGLLRTAKNAAIGRQKFSNLVNVDPGSLRLDDIESQVLVDVKSAALDRYGVEVQFVGIRRIGLPEAITESVFERMRAERTELADRYRSEGEGEAIKIRAQADGERDKLLAQAEADAKRIRAEGDAAAAEYYQVFEKNPDLAIFLRKLEVLEETLKEKATVVLSTDTEPFDILKSAKPETK